MRGVLSHETAVREHLPEQYVLGELTGRRRDNFERHFFGCKECGEDTHLAAVFAANAREVLREDAALKKRPPDHRNGRQLKQARRRPHVS